MVKRCCVTNCRSGTHADRRMRSEHGERQLSHFQLPKDSEEHQRWVDILGPLSARGVVCELHFADADIKKTDNTILSDGTEHKMPRFRWDLKPGALPLPIENGVSASMFYEPKHLPSQNHDDEPEARRSTETVEQMAEKDSTILASGNEETGGNSEGTTSDEEHIVEMLDVDNETARNTEDESHVYKYLMEMHQIKSVSGQKFTINDIRNGLERNILPRGWSWTSTTKSLIFTLHDSFSLEGRIHVEVEDNLAASICTSTHQRLPLDPITSFRELQLNFKIVQKLQICNGTGMNEERRAPGCMGILDEKEEYKRLRCRLRCFRCRELRRTLRKRKNREKFFAETVNPLLRRKLATAERRSKRLKFKTEKLKLEINQLRTQYAAMEEIALEAQISGLSENEQNIIRKRFSAAKHVNTRRNQYTRELIHECVLMCKRKSLQQEPRLGEPEIVPTSCNDQMDSQKNHSSLTPT